MESDILRLKMREGSRKRGLFFRIITLLEQNTGNIEMKYQLPTKFYLFIKELVLIRKGQHVHFKGDSRYNSEALCFEFGRTNPEEATLFANRILEKCEYIDLPLPTLNILVKKLRQGVEFSE